MQYQVVLPANEWKRIDLRGRLLVVLDQGAASNIGVQFFQGAHTLEEIESAGTGFRAAMNQGQFTGIALRADAPATVKIIVTDNTIDFDWFEGSSVSVVTSIGDPLYVSPVDPPAQSITDNAAVAVGDVAVQLVAADANRRALRFANLGVSAVALGSAGITWAKRVVVLQPGDVWIEDRAGNLAWYGITDTGGAASVTVQEVGV